ncbi:hypothetical protein EW145_g5391 [Phellinidium pouzarii]|uniref:Pyruvate decarboxylase n=1 Tax=Phellinidium pouzarii TaxID=167371 RepID=A0A4V3XC62_9AGAM|nr:hypothetical protein EW145_g5391 [Phellinidium pouzarii]
MYTTSSIFLKTLTQCGITHAFVNWGSDHPALLEELERQRVANGKSDLEIITCPNEMVALSAAQGYAQACGRPAAVLVHVDVGTQALAGAVHNVDRGRVPVFIYAGASPFTAEGELKGSRNEWIMWLQGYPFFLPITVWSSSETLVDSFHLDVHDQSAIVRQYMRFTGQINSGKNVSQVIRRGLQLAMSEPKGPVYLWARREVMEEEVDEDLAKAALDVRTWAPLEPLALNPSAANAIARALSNATSPLIITSFLGRNPEAVEKLTMLSEALAIPVLVSCPTTVNFQHSHANFIEVSSGMGTSEWLRSADVILIIDSDIPYIPMHNKPRADAKIFHVDIDPLKENMGMFHIEAVMRCKADAQVALSQILEHLSSNVEPIKTQIAQRAEKLKEHKHKRISSLDVAESALPANGSFTIPNIIAVLRKSLPVPERTIFLNESISSYPLVWDHLRPEFLGSVISSGSSSLGWGLGAAVGVSLARTGPLANDPLDLIILIVGDGSFLFGVPSSAFWMAKRYNTVS